MPALIGPDGRHYQLRDGVVVGRVGADGAQPDVDLGELERGKTISRRHARIVRRGQEWYLRVESKVTNATKVAGRPLNPGEESALSDGDEVALGAVPMIFLADWDSEATMVGISQANAEIRVDGRTFPLTTTEGRRLRIGRRSADGSYRPDIDLRDVRGSVSVSHLHGHLIRSNGRDWSLHVVTTTNGTIVAGRDVQPGETVPLNDGDTVQLGRVRATFHQKTAPRVVGNDLLQLSTSPEELVVEAGGEQRGRINIVNLSGRVEQVVLELTGVPDEWFTLTLPDGSTGKSLNLQLLNAVEPNRPSEGTSAEASVRYAPPRVPESRAGIYPISISATTRGEDVIRRVVTSRLRVLPFEGLEITSGPEEVKRSRGEFWVEVHNTGNTEVGVDVRTDTHEIEDEIKFAGRVVHRRDKKVKVEPAQQQFRLLNGHNRKVPFVVRARRHWLGYDKTYGVDVTTIAGGQKRSTQARLVVAPLLPRWMQFVVGKLIAIASPIALPVLTIALLLGVAFFLLRPPDIRDFRAEPSSIVAGTETQLVWTVNGGLLPPSGVSLDPPVSDKLNATEGRVAVAPLGKTEYTLTARNWLGLISSSKKTAVDVLQITAFKATPERLNKEREEVALHWETIGATKIQIEPADEIKDPKATGDAAVHPAAPTTYKLTATGTGGVTATAEVSVAIGSPSVTRFDVVPGPTAGRVFQGDPVQLTWAVAGFSKVTITSNKGNVTPGQAEIDVTGGPPAIVYPAAPGEVVYTLTASNAAGSTQSTRSVNVSPVSIVQFEAEPTSITPGQPAKLRWRIERANDATKVVLEPGLGPVEGVGERSVSPTVDTTYLLRMTAADGTTQEREVQITVEKLPTINVFTAPRPSIGFGEEARLTWSVADATRIEIRTADGIPLLSTDKPEGTLVDFPPTATTYIIEARSASGKSVKKDVSIDVRPPGQPTPAPAPPPADPAAPAAPGASTNPPAPGVPAPAGSPAPAKP
jgi:pSer/pThr/pTyr-binding forkhead associated (FHA) protein